MRSRTLSTAFRQSASASAKWLAGLFDRIGQIDISSGRSIAIKLPRYLHFTHLAQVKVGRDEFVGR